MLRDNLLSSVDGIVTELKRSSPCLSGSTSIMGNTESKFTSFYKFLDKKGVELQNGELVVLRKCASLDSRRKEYSVLLYNQPLLEKWVKERFPSSEVNEALSACIKVFSTML